MATSRTRSPHALPVPAPVLAPVVPVAPVVPAVPTLADLDLARALLDQQVIEARAQLAAASPVNRARAMRKVEQVEYDREEAHLAWLRKLVETALAQPNMTKSELSRQAHVSWRTIHRCLNGTHSIPAVRTALETVATALVSMAA